MKIEELNLSVRARNALMRAGVRTTEQLMTLEVDDLRKMRNIGKKTLYEVQRTMKKVEELEREASMQQVPNGSHLHGYQEGRESYELPCEDCRCFDCDDDCSVCWSGPLCAFDDESPCVRKRREKGLADG